MLTLLQQPVYPWSHGPLFDGFLRLENLICTSFHSTDFTRLYTAHLGRGEGQEKRQGSSVLQMTRNSSGSMQCSQWPLEVTVPTDCSEGWMVALRHPQSEPAFVEDQARGLTPRVVDLVAAPLIPVGWAQKTR